MMAWSDEAILKLIRDLNASLVTINESAAALGRLLRRAEARDEEMAKTLDEVLEQVRATRGYVKSVSELIGGLKQQVTDALANTSPRISDADQAKIDEIFTEAEAASTEAAAAIGANSTPSDPVPPPPVDRGG
jgi:ABC-type transporter Mla subunit MlaD